MSDHDMPDHLLTAYRWWRNCLFDSVTRLDLAVKRLPDEVATKEAEREGHVLNALSRLHENEILAMYEEYRDRTEKLFRSWDNI